MIETGVGVGFFGFNCKNEPLNVIKIKFTVGLKVCDIVKISFKLYLQVASTLLKPLIHTPSDRKARFLLDPKALPGESIQSSEDLALNMAAMTAIATLAVQSFVGWCKYRLMT